MSTTVPLSLRNPGHLCDVGKQNPGHLWVTFVMVLEKCFDDQGMMIQVLCNTGNLADFPLGLPNVTQVDDQFILKS